MPKHRLLLCTSCHRYSEKRLENPPFSPKYPLSWQQPISHFGHYPTWEKLHSPYGKNQRAFSSLLGSMVSQILTAIASISTILPEPWGDRLHYLYLNDRFAPLANLFLGSEIQPVGCLWACSHGSYPAHHSKSHGVASQLLHICVATINYKLPFWDINLPFLDRIDMSNNSMLYIFWSTTIAMTN